MKKNLGYLAGTFGLALLLPVPGISAQSPDMPSKAADAVASKVITLSSAAARPEDHGSGFGDIPNPADVTVTRENLKRVINALHKAGLNRQQIKRWINASLDAAGSPPDIPNPGDIAVTRENFKRVVNALLKAGLNRQQVKRWIHASLNAGDLRPDGPLIARPEVADKKPAAPIDRIKPTDTMPTVRPAAVDKVAVVRPVQIRPQKIRVQKPARIAKVAKPVRIIRAK